MKKFQRHGTTKDTFMKINFSQILQELGLLTNFGRNMFLYFVFIPALFHLVRRSKINESQKSQNRLDIHKIISHIVLYELLQFSCSTVMEKI